MLGKVLRIARDEQLQQAQFIVRVDLGQAPVVVRAEYGVVHPGRGEETLQSGHADLVPQRVLRIVVRLSDHRLRQVGLVGAEVLAPLELV